MYTLFCVLLVALSSTVASLVPAPNGPWDRFNIAPKSRNFPPSAVYSVSGNVANAAGLVDGSNSAATLKGVDSSIVLDFGKEVGGLVSFDIVQATELSSFSLSFTESPSFISPSSSDSSRIPTRNADGVLTVVAPLDLGRFTQPQSRLRGGFRYLTLTSTSDDELSLANLTIQITFMPHWDQDLSRYTGYFTCNDTASKAENLSALWYAGAYTVQTNTIASNTAKQFPVPPNGWQNDASAGAIDEQAVIVSGAKRDRVIRSADLAIAMNTQLVSTFDMESARNSLYVLFTNQDPLTGALPFSGPPQRLTGSTTYICWSLIAMHTYWINTDDTDFVFSLWPRYTLAMDFLGRSVDTTGLLNVAKDWSEDWGRPGPGTNAAANALFYRALITGAQLSSLFNDPTLSDLYTRNATTLKAAFNDKLWDNAAGLYRENDVSNLKPQDGNSLAVIYNLTTSGRNPVVSTALARLWTDLGAVSPELGSDDISVFASGLELRAHFIAGNGTRAIDLMNRTWGHMLRSPLGVQSTLWEGMSKNGSFAYREQESSYTSMSHSWSTAPTAALTSHVLGLQLTSPKGRTFLISPILSGLKNAEGGFSTELGFFAVSWTLTSRGVWTVVTDMPEGTIGTLIRPSSTSRLSGGRVGLVEELTDITVTPGRQVHVLGLGGQD